ncbi:hypothetical protein [Aestuariivivens sediminis]|uniref:hypothetical protein n=1 Tax=Aestuariivivens sediminis TaxID=2913557 RepID=UPI001F5A6843|nr:hypothetical protein [Aestuariivivens sediminis]
MNMMNGWVILSIVALLFIGMYIYANIFVFLERIREKKRKKEELHNLELLEQEKERKNQIREEKFKKLRDRSEEIKQELKRLELMKANRMKSQKAH